MQCSTFILYFNKPALTLRCLESVLKAQEKIKKPCNITVVSNGSTRENIEIIENFIRQKAPQITHEKIPSNLGFSQGMNFGLQSCFSAHTQYVLSLSNDIELPDDFYTHLDQQSDFTGVLCPQTYFLMSKKPAYTHGHVDCENYTLSHHFDSEKRTILFPEYYPAAGLLWSKSAFEALDGFNKNYFCYWEDVDLSFRAAKKHIPLELSRTLLMYHLGRGTTKGKKAYSKHFADGQNYFRNEHKNSL